MKETYEIAGMLQKHDIQVVKCPWNNTPQVWLNARYIGVEVSEDYMLKTVALFADVYTEVSSSELTNGNFLIKGRKVKEKVENSIWC